MSEHDYDCVYESALNATFVRRHVQTDVPVHRTPEVESAGGGRELAHVTRPHSRDPRHEDDDRVRGEHQ
jgi:hypothetical protein